MSGSAFSLVATEHYRARPQHCHVSSHLLVGAAVATYAAEHSIYDLNETQDEFKSPECQEDRK